MFIRLLLSTTQRFKLIWRASISALISASRRQVSQRLESNFTRNKATRNQQCFKIESIDHHQL